MKEGWQPMDTAPRDGTLVELTWFGTNGEPQEIYPMRWGHIQRNALFAPGVVGMWVLDGGGATWTEHDPDGAPEGWEAASLPSPLPMAGRGVMNAPKPFPKLILDCLWEELPDENTEREAHVAFMRRFAERQGFGKATYTQYELGYILHKVFASLQYMDWDFSFNEAMERTWISHSPHKEKSDEMSDMRSALAS